MQPDKEKKRFHPVRLSLAFFVHEPTHWRLTEISSSTPCPLSSFVLISTISTNFSATVCQNKFQYKPETCIYLCLRLHLTGMLCDTCKDRNLTCNVWSPYQPSLLHAVSCLNSASQLFCVISLLQRYI